MTTYFSSFVLPMPMVVEAYRLDRYDNTILLFSASQIVVVEAYRLDRYDN